MLNSYLPIVALIGIAAVIAFAMVGGSFFLGPKKPGAIKSSPYECGMTPVGSARERFPIKFYLIAMLFIIFDIETIFLYPWAVNYGRLGHSLKVFNFIEMAVFVLILFVGYFYIRGKGALDWDESDQAKNRDVMTDAVRARRAAITFGNESSGPTDITKTPIGPRYPGYGASSQEETQHVGIQIPDQREPHRIAP